MPRPSSEQIPRNRALHIAADRVETGCGLAFVWFVSLLGLGLLAGMFGVPQLLIALGPTTLLLLLLWPILAIFQPAIRTGDDGVSFHSWAGSRFVSFFNIEKVTCTPGNRLQSFPVHVLTLHLRDNRTKRIVGLKPRIWKAFRELEVRLRRHRTQSAPIPPAILRKQGTSPTERVEALQQVGSGSAASMRIAPTERSALWEVALSAACEGVDRAAAVVALAGHADEEDRKTLRIAAEASADPKLRVVFDTALDDAAETEALATALAGMGESADHTRHVTRE